MLHVLQVITIDFKRFSQSPGYSMQHESQHGLAPIDIERFAEVAF
jgi:hypothetical protein